MKLRNKKTGKIIETDAELRIEEPTSPTFGCPSYDIIASYNSLAELNEEWEDYEEPKKSWFIDTWGSIREREAMEIPIGWKEKPILEFETEEEAEKAVEKLKAWKRLKDWGFEFCGVGDERDTIRFVVARPPLDMQGYWTEEIHKCFDLLFGGEE